MALGALLHVAGFRRPAAVQAGAVPPLGVQGDSIRRICHEQERLAVNQQPRHRSGRMASPMNIRCWLRRLPASHRSPGRDTGSSSRGSKPVKLKSKSAATRSWRLRDNSPSSNSAQATERFTRMRNAFTCASVHSPQRITGMPVSSLPGHDPNYRAAFRRKCPSSCARFAQSLMRRQHHQYSHVRFPLFGFQVSLSMQGPIRP
jgi:hypothetical protein